MGFQLLYCFYFQSFFKRQYIHSFHLARCKNKKYNFLFPRCNFSEERDCQTALGNIKIALVRPSVLFCNSVDSSFISSNSESKEQIVINIMTRVAILNLFLGFLNLIPIGSLDGGTLLKSIVWYFSGSKNKGKNF